MTSRLDYILVGGGLQNALMLLAIRRTSPEARIALVEKSERLGGNHTWCYHAEDLSAAMREVVRDLTVHRWPGYRVKFPHGERLIGREYAAVTSDRLHDVVSGAFDGADASELILGKSVTKITERSAELEDGRRLDAKVVIDARGPGAASPKLPAGFQKFLGLEFLLEERQRLNLPIVMDATVDQTDGYRFMYVLPLSSDRVLLEDTYFNRSPEIDRERITRNIHRYAERAGLKTSSVVREETGVLPMPWSGSLPRKENGPLRAGYGGGWFHPATGYSFPVAARLAETVAQTPVDQWPGRGLAALIREHNSQARYCHVLNRFLFRWYPPTKRWHIFERFYRLPEPTIARFYALKMNKPDRVRLVAGRPPSGLSVRHRLQAGVAR